MPQTAPDAGQLVSIRNRLYVVADVNASDLPATGLQPLAPPQHLVTLKSVEDDGIGEELRVIWELEPGARALPGAGLPTPTAFDPPARLDAFLDAIRWGAIASAEVRRLQSPFRAGIEIEDYQLEPVIKALEMPRVSLLVADDVGLGKTIEAGMVALELILRHRTQTILIVCPASLQRQWQDQMRDKFGLEFRIVNRDYLRELRRRRGIHASPWTDYPRLIVSLDYLKREPQMKALREVLPAPNESRYPRRFDLLILDEAHNVAPSGSANYALDSQKTQAIRTLVPHFTHKLFLTATPHNGYQQSFGALLELLDDQRFARGVPPDRRQLEAVMIRRLKDDIVDDAGRRRFPPRVITPIEVAYSEDERRAHRLLEEFGRLRREAGQPGETPGRTRGFAQEFVLKLLKKRLFSSPEAFRRTLEAHRASLSADRERRALPPPDAGLLRRAIEEADEEFDDDEQRDEQETDALETAGRALPPLTPEQRRVFDDLLAWAEDAAQRADAKARELIAWLAATIRPGGVWSDRRVIIFTEYRDTQRWLLDLLTGEGFTADGRLLELYGGMDSDDREAVKAAFQASPAESPVRILLATDAASEGLDLQNHCSRVIHYEIPWNPNRLEQRNGRVDRHGQRADVVEVFHFVGAGFATGAAAGRAPGTLEGDLEFIARAARKVETIRQDLGKVGPVIAQQVEDAMLGRRRTLDTAAAESDARRLRTQIPHSLRVREELAAARARLAQTREELRLEPERVQAVVETALALAGQPPLRAVALPGGGSAALPPATMNPHPNPSSFAKGEGLGVRVSPEGAPAPFAFEVPQLTGDWNAALTGLRHPHTLRPRPITFDPEVARGRDNVVLAHLNSRLVETSLRVLRSEVWAARSRYELHRATARVAPDTALEHPAVVAHARLVVTGADGDRLHEEIITVGGYIRENRFVRFARVGDAQALIDAASDAMPSPATQRALLEEWPRHEDALRAALEARKRDRLNGLQTRLEERQRSETAAITGVLEELGRAIDKLITEAGGDAPQQLALFTLDERDQYDRDLEALRRRRAEIPGEMTKETEVIARRYAAPEVHVFPAALTFLVPSRLAGREFLA